MRMRGKHVYAMANTGQRDIIDLAPLAGKETLIFHAPHRLPNSEFDHLLKSLRLRFAPFRHDGMFATFGELGDARGLC